MEPETGRYIALGAFGKHPGWDDHIEDLGLDDDSLNLAKQVFYVQGVGGQINTGAWEKLKEEQRLAAFEHTFIWLRGGQFLMGQMWSSSDGKGRTRYPMIVCVHCVGTPLNWALQSVLPRLIEAERDCQEAKTAEQVRSILSAARSRLRNAARTAGGGTETEAPGSGALSRFVSAPAFGPAREGWFRLLYWLQSQAGAFAPGRYEFKEDMSVYRAQQVRVPMGAESPAEAIPLWARFLAGYVDPSVPLLFVWPVNGGWMDITFGEPSTQEFFCLRASRAAIPLATEIPYDFDQTFRGLATQLMTDFQNGVAPRASISRSGEGEAGAGVTSVTQRWFKSLTGKFLMVLAAVLLLAAAAMIGVFLPASGIRIAWNSAPASPRAGVGSPTKAQIARPQQTQTSAGMVAPKTAAEAVGQARAAQDAAAPRVDPKAGGQAPPAVETDAVLAEKSAVKPLGIGAASAIAQRGSLAASSRGLHAETSGNAITNGIGMVVIWVAGLPDSGDGGWVGKYEVTQAEYERVTGANPSIYKDPAQPVENITWNEASDFCRKLNADENEMERLPSGFAYALPTQQQWDFFLGDAGFDKSVTSRNRPTIRTEPSLVGTMPPNQYGLCDVLGNVWEWCVDSDSPGQKVLKGGAYDNQVSFQFRTLERTTARHVFAYTKAPDAGFRCVLARQPETGVTSKD